MEANAALELLLDRMMAVHPEVNGGGDVKLTRDGYLLRIELTKRFPPDVKPSDTFMGYPVKYVVTGWASGMGCPYLGMPE